MYDIEKIKRMKYFHNKNSVVREKLRAQKPCSDKIPYKK